MIASGYDAIGKVGDLYPGQEKFVSKMDSSLGECVCNEEKLK